MEVNDPFHAPAALPSGKDTPRHLQSRKLGWCGRPGEATNLLSLLNFEPWFLSPPTRLRIHSSQRGKERLLTFRVTRNIKLRFMGGWGHNSLKYKHFHTLRFDTLTNLLNIFYKKNIAGITYNIFGPS